MNPSFERMLARVPLESIATPYKFIRALPQQLNCLFDSSVLKMHSEDLASCYCEIIPPFPSGPGAVTHSYGNYRSSCSDDAVVFEIPSLFNPASLITIWGYN